MPAIRSTVMRLERQIQLEQAQALTSLHQSFEELVKALLTVARERGYLGADPLGALSHIASPTTWEGKLGEAALELWRTFFECFRSDEANFEAARLQEKAGQLNERLNAVPPGEWPTPELSVALLRCLAGLWADRHEAISERLDSLIGDLSEHQARLGSADLERAHQSDEMARALTIVATALADLGEKVDKQTPPSQLLAGLITRYRREFSEMRKQVAAAATARRAFLDGLIAAAKGAKDMPELPSAEKDIADGVGRMIADRRVLDEQLRDLKGQLARVQAEQRELMEEVAARDRRLAKYELGTNVLEDEDERLALYRQAFTEWEAGRDPKEILARVRHLERVIIASAADEQKAIRVLDRQLAEVVKCLQDLRELMPLTDDPKRFRPRLLLGSRYNLKALVGQCQAIRDAARDLHAFIERMRWAAGVRALAKDLTKLQRVFREMIELVATWREQMGDPPPVSISLHLEQGSSIIALPALLASDLESVIKRRSKPAAQAAQTIVPVMDECVKLYHRTLEKAKGETIPRPEVPKREGANQALLRLAGELTALGGTMEAAFGEAAATDFRLEEPDERLLSDDHVLLLALQQLDVACEVLAALPGAPKAQFTGLPSGRGSEKLYACGNERVAWLEELARYRFEIQEAYGAARK